MHFVGIFVDNQSATVQPFWEAFDDFSGCAQSVNRAVLSHDVVLAFADEGGKVAIERKRVVGFVFPVVAIFLYHDGIAQLGEVLAYVKTPNLQLLLGLEVDEKVEMLGVGFGDVEVEWAVNVGSGGRVI